MVPQQPIQLYPQQAVQLVPQQAVKQVPQQAVQLDPKKLFNWIPRSCSSGSQHAVQLNPQQTLHKDQQLCPQLYPPLAHQLEQEQCLYKRPEAASSAKMVCISPLTPLGKSWDASDPQNKDFIQDFKDGKNHKPSPRSLLYP